MTETHFIQVNDLGNNDTGDYQVSVTDTTGGGVNALSLEDVLDDGGPELTSIEPAAILGDTAPMPVELTGLVIAEDIAV